MCPCQQTKRETVRWLLLWRELEDSRTSNTAKSTQTAHNLEWDQDVCLFTHDYHNCIFHSNTKIWQKLPDTPPCERYWKRSMLGLVGSGNETTKKLLGFIHKHSIQKLLYTRYWTWCCYCLIFFPYHLCTYHLIRKRICPSISVAHKISSAAKPLRNPLGSLRSGTATLLFWFCPAHTREVKLWWGLIGHGS